jgi:hypothetical chaperone protein
LVTTATRHLGHRIAFSVEDGKIALSDSSDTRIDLDFLERGLGAPATRAQLDRTVEKEIAKLDRAISTCLIEARLSPKKIETVFVTGGTARVPAVRAAIAQALPEARIAQGDDFLSVALGLTRAAERRYR